MEKSLPLIPAKRYFTIGEVSELCGVKPYVLRYWEQEFTQLKPMKRRGNRRYYQHHEVLLVRRIRELLYDQGFTINGARNRLSEPGAAGAARAAGPMRGARLPPEPAAVAGPGADTFDDDDEYEHDAGAASSGVEASRATGDTSPAAGVGGTATAAAPPAAAPLPPMTRTLLRAELVSILALLAE
jgi:DNA-binding transcriptional MerR regulator